MNEEKSKERPTFGEDVAAAAQASDTAQAGPSGAKGAPADARSAATSAAREVVAVRLSTEELAALDEVREQLGGSRSDALRASVTSVHEALASGSVDKVDDVLAKRMSHRRSVALHEDSAALVALRESLQDVSKRYAEQAFQLQRIGNNWNQIVRLANSGEAVPVDAVNRVGRVLEELLKAMQRDAQRDSAVQYRALKGVV